MNPEQRSKAARWAREIGSDLVILGGVTVAGWGIQLISLPAAWIFAGLALAGLGYLIGRGDR